MQPSTEPKVRLQSVKVRVEGRSWTQWIQPTFLGHLTVQEKRRDKNIVCIIGISVGIERECGKIEKT